MSARRMLSEPEAWREIARRFAGPRPEGARGFCFLCNEAWFMSLGNAPLIDDAMHEAMVRRVQEHRDLAKAHGEPRLWNDLDYRTDGRQTRILAALFLALEAEEEAASAHPGELP